MRNTLFSIFTVYCFNDFFFLNWLQAYLSVNKQKGLSFLLVFTDFSEPREQRLLFFQSCNDSCSSPRPRNVGHIGLQRWFKVPIFWGAFWGISPQPFLSKCIQRASTTKQSRSNSFNPRRLGVKWVCRLGPSPERYLPPHLDSLRGHQPVICLPLQQSSSRDSWQHLLSQTYWAERDP